MTPRIATIASMFSTSDIGRIIKGLDEHAKTLRQLAGGHRYSGPSHIEYRAWLRREARRYTELAREFEKGLL